MGQEIIDIGAAPNDGLGDPLRTAFEFTNNNFTQLFSYPNPIPPNNTLIGKVGDVPGMYAYSADYFYYCFGTYDGTSTIWAILPSTSATLQAGIANNLTEVYTYNNGNVTVSVGGAGNVAVFTPTGVVLRGNISATGGISTTGNVTGNYIYGNGVFLTGITAVGSVYSNANVANYLPVYSGNIGNIVTNNITTSGQISATGDIITDGLFIGTFQGNITGNLVVPGANTQVIYNNNGAANASSAFKFNTSGNVLTVLGSICSPTVNANRVNANSIAVAGVIQTTNVVANGSGSFSNGIYAGNSIVSNGVISAIGNIYGNYIFGNFSANATNAVYATNAGTVINNSQPNITSVGNTLTIGTIFLNGVSNTANVHNINTSTINASTTNSNIVVATSVTGTLLTNAQPNITSVGTLTNLSVAGNISSGTLSTGNISSTGSVSVTGNITSCGSASVASNLSVGGNIMSTGNLLVGGGVSSVGNLFISSNGNIINNLSVGNNLSVTGKIFSTGGISTQGSITSQGTISATGNMYTSGYFIGNFQGNVSGNFTVAGSNTQIIYNANGLAGASAGFTFTSGPNALSILGTVNAQGNITGGNLITSGIASVGSIISSTTISAGGNISGSNISAGGNVFATNITTSGIICSAGNVTSPLFVGNLSAPGVSQQMLMNRFGIVSPATGLNYNVCSGLLSATGNVGVGHNITASTITGSLTTSTQSNITIVGSPLSVGSTGQGTLNAGIVNSNSVLGTILTASQPYISAVGTLYNLCVNGQISTAGNIVGCGQGITNINGCTHVSGVVPYASVLTSGSWAISASGTTISFYYGGAKVVTIDSTGNITAAKTVTGYGTP